MDTDTDGAFEDWCMSHQPFHRFIEFYATMNMGGFDVVVGNPPYVKTKTLPYSVKFLEKNLFSGHLRVRSNSLSQHHQQPWTMWHNRSTFPDIQLQISELRAELTRWVSLVLLL